LKPTDDAPKKDVRADIGMDWMSNSAHAVKAPKEGDEVEDDKPKERNEDDVVVYKNELNPNINSDAKKADPEAAKRCVKTTDLTELRYEWR